MKEPDRVAEVIGEWVVKAENDLRNAVHTLTMGSDAPTDTICFHAQQCVEKYLKALLVLYSIPVPKTHKLRALLKLIPADSRPDMEGPMQDQITAYAVMPRYPDGGLEISVSEARKAVAVARRVRKEVRRLLPKAALRRKKK